MSDNLFDLAFDCVVPSSIFSNKNLEPNCIKLYAYVRNLAKRDGYCYASNEYLADLMECKIRAIQRLLLSLETEGYLERKDNEFGGREIYISDEFKKKLGRVKKDTGGCQKRHPNKKNSIIEEDNSPPYPPKEGSGCGSKDPGTGALHAEEEAKRKVVSLRLEILTMKEEGKPPQKFTKRERERFLRTYSLDHILDCLNALSKEHDMSKLRSVRAILISEFEKDPSKKGSKHV